MATQVSHKDETRRGVSTTAHAVASMRGLEGLLNPETALFNDPYGKLLGGDIGLGFAEDRVCHERSLADMVDGIAIRTRKIDDEIRRAIDTGFRQICVLGAGLDARPWRLKKGADHKVHYFEVDFPEIFKYKLATLKSVHAKTEFTYHSVCCDLSLDHWTEHLIAAGFDVQQPTLWVMEGLIGYLTEEEASALFHILSTELSAPESRIVATFLTPGCKTSTAMHRFFPENPLSFVNSHGWTGEQDEIEAIGRQYNRPLHDKFMSGYYILVVDFKM